MPGRSEAAQKLWATCLPWTNGQLGVDGISCELVRPTVIRLVIQMPKSFQFKLVLCFFCLIVLGWNCGKTLTILSKRTSP